MKSNTYNIQWIWFCFIRKRNEQNCQTVEQFTFIIFKSYSVEVGRNHLHCFMSTHQLNGIVLQFLYAVAVGILILDCFFFSFSSLYDRRLLFLRASRSPFVVFFIFFFSFYVGILDLFASRVCLRCVCTQTMLCDLAICITANVVKRRYCVCCCCYFSFGDFAFSSSLARLDGSTALLALQLFGDLCCSVFSFFGFLIIFSSVSAEKTKKHSHSHIQGDSCTAHSIAQHNTHIPDNSWRFFFYYIHALCSVILLRARMNDDDEKKTFLLQFQWFCST